MQYKILAVDDNPINLDLIQKSVVDTSYQIITTTSGEESLKVAAEELPDLILLDVMMPGMDGFTVCQKLKENETTRQIPVIFLSAKIRPEDKARGLAVGGIDYLSKPFNSIELIARIRAHIASKIENEDIEFAALPESHY
jgi:DNA-binding response OmpR family regulator